MKEQLSRELRAFEADHAWIGDNLRALQEQYPDQWIAVRNGQVIASDLDLAGLLPKLPDPAHTCVEFITGEPLEIVLRSAGRSSELKLLEPASQEIV